MKLRLLNNFYVMYKDNSFVLTNTQTHKSYILDSEKMAVLANPDLAVLDDDFVEAGIVGQAFVKESDWPFAPISKLFLESISIKENETETLVGREFWENYLGVCSEILNKIHETKLPDCLQQIDLPVANEMHYDFHTLLKKRRTIREFYNQTVSLQYLTDILYTTFGEFHDGFEEKYLDVEKTLSWRRSSPSAGGLHPIDAYVFVHNVEGLSQGLYFYDCRANNLRLIKLKDYEKQFLDVFMGQYFYQNAAFHILTVGNLKTVAAKYAHSRAFLFPYIENGHLVQTAWLSAVAFGLKGWMTCAFSDEFFVKELGLENSQVPISFLSVGYGCDQSLGPKINKELEEIGYSRDFVAAMAMKMACREKVK